MTTLHPVLILAAFAIGLSIPVLTGHVQPPFGSKRSVAPAMAGQPAKARIDVMTITKRQTFSDDLVHATRSAAMHGLGKKGPCQGQHYCQPAKTEELANPPITLELTREAMQAGVYGAAARWCGIAGYERLLLALVFTSMRDHGLGERGGIILAHVYQLSFAGVAKGLPSVGTCPEEVRRTMSEMVESTPRVRDDGKPPLLRGSLRI